MRSGNFSLYFLFFCFLLFTCATGKVMAHKVIVFAWVEDGMVYTESGFGGTRKVKNGTILVYDENETLILQGKTDDEGNFSFIIPKGLDTGLIVRLDASTGHQAEWRLDKKELVQTSTVGDINKAMEQKTALEKSPSVFKIGGGLIIIFGLAFLTRFFLRRKR